MRKYLKPIAYFCLLLGLPCVAGAQEYFILGYNPSLSKDLFQPDESNGNSKRKKNPSA